MTALAIAIAYLGTLAFVAGLIERRSRQVPDLPSVLARLSAIEGRAKAWDGAASYVEAKQIEAGTFRR